MSNPPADNSLENSPTPSLDRAYNSRAAWLRFLIPAIIGLVADLYVKAWAFPNGVVEAGLYPAGRVDPYPLIPNILAFTTTVNRGAVFGTFQGKVNWFIPFSIIAMIIILWVFLSSRKDQKLVHITLGMITAGAIGNFYDRLVYSGVRDMFKFTCFQFHKLTPDGRPVVVDYYPYIFNIADVLLCVAVPLLMIRWLFTKDHQVAKEPRT